jgi:hypothetical protein
MLTLTPDVAERLARIALGHVGREFPYKLDQVLNAASDLAAPRARHPIFYGSFDWHSSVHSHWLLARVLRRFPESGVAEAIGAWLDGAFTDAKVAGELASLAQPGAAGFERPYGWAWLLMLQAELEAGESVRGRRWAEAMRPLARAFEARLLAWLPKATYPIRVGTHGSTAFALVLINRYTPFAADKGLATALRKAARRWYGADADAPAWEPGGNDFLSPTLIEAHAMADLVPADAFAAWFARFLPRLSAGEPATLFAPIRISDRADGQIAHLDGLSLSRAWSFRRLARAMPALAPRLDAAADRHLEAALPHLAADYMGEHWLASFALMALDDT